MPLASEDFFCHKFQPNLFDPSRCLSCLRMRHLHTNTPPQDDSDGLSVVSSHCDVTSDQLHYEESSFCILSPNCHLYICNEDDSPESTQDPSDYSELSDSISPEEYYSPHKETTLDRTMTRLDPPPHRPNPRAWMEEARGRDGFSSHAGFKGNRDHESKYYSLGRAGGVRSIREKSPPPPHRHFETGRALPNHHSPERKAAIPFRNPDLGVPSQRRSLEIQQSDPPQDSSLPSGYSESNYNQGFDYHRQRSLSPTPFKQAESLSDSLHRSYDGSYSRGLGPSYSSSHQQRGHFSASQRQASSFSRSSSPCQTPSPFKQAELSSSAHRRNFASSQDSSQGSRPSTKNLYGRVIDSGGFQKNLRTISHTIDSYSQSDSFGTLKSSLRQTKVNVTSARGFSSHDSSPSRRGYEIPNQSLLCKSETKTSTTSHAWGSRGSSPSRRGYESPSQSKALTKNYALNRHCTSPSRRGYDSPSQSLLRKSETVSPTSTRAHKGCSLSPSRRGSGAPNQSFLQNKYSNKFSGGCDLHSPTPSRTVYNTSTQSALCRAESKSPSSARSQDSRSPSPARRGCGTPTPSSLLKSTGYNSRSSPPPRRAHDKTQSYQRKVSDSTPISDSMPYKLNKTSQSTPSPSSWRSSSHSLISPVLSRSPSPSRRLTQDHHLDVCSRKSRSVSSEAAISGNNSVRRQPEAQSPFPEYQPSSHQNRSPSPQMQKHTSSHSSLESESSHVSGVSVLNKEEYALMADLPKVKTIYEREGPDHFGKTQRQTPGKEELYKPARGQAVHLEKKSTLGRSSLDLDLDTRMRSRCQRQTDQLDIPASRKRQLEEL